MAIINMLVWISGVCIILQYILVINLQAFYVYTWSYSPIVEKICIWLADILGTRLYTLHSIVMEGRTCNTDILDHQELTLHFQQHS